MISNGVLPEKQLLGKADTMKTFEYSPLGSELKKQTSIREKQYKILSKAYELAENEYETFKKTQQLENVIDQI